MKRWTHFALAIVAAVSLACGDGNRDATEPAIAPGAAGTAGTAGADIDRDFVEDQLATGHTEVELGRMAQERATNPQVKEFGEMMVRDHQQAGAQLREIAGDHNIQPGEAHEHKDLQERLSKLSGAEFDREYMKAMVEDHEKAVNELEQKAENADNPQVRQWASNTLPTLRQHLDRARQINQKLEQGGSAPGYR